jgi:hypothetical protein
MSPWSGAVSKNKEILQAAFQKGFELAQRLVS